jgi:hypothetical protein
MIVMYHILSTHFEILLVMHETTRELNNQGNNSGKYLFQPEFNKISQYFLILTDFLPTLSASTHLKKLPSS